MFEEKEKYSKRRKGTKKMKEKAKRVGRLFSKDEKWTNDFSNRNFNHLQKCSCPMCGNPRKHNKGKQRKTMQELSFDDIMKEGDN